jgi:hypothetical protein
MRRFAYLRNYRDRLGQDRHPLHISSQLTRVFLSSLKDARSALHGTTQGYLDGRGPTHGSRKKWSVCRKCCGDADRANHLNISISFDVNRRAGNVMQFKMLESFLKGYAGGTNPTGTLGVQRRTFSAPSSKYQSNIITLSYSMHKGCKTLSSSS